MAITTATAPRAWAMDVRGLPASDVVPDALVLLTSTVSGFVNGDAPSVRVPYVTDAAAGFVAEAATIAEATPTLSEVTVYTGKVAQLVRLSSEQYGQADTASLLTDSVRRAVTNAANIAYLSQVAPTGPAVTPPAGLLNVTGITNGGAMSVTLDKLVDAQTSIAVAGGNATHIISSPAAWASLSKLKTATGSNLSIIGSNPADPLTRQLLGIPVLVSSAMTAGSLIVIDKSAVVSAVGPVVVAVSDQAYFASDSIGLRCTFRFGQNVVRPDRVVKLTA
jgi:HK97 family phage major capsid protein